MHATHKICRACGRVFRGVEIFCPEDGSRLHTASHVDSRLSDPLVGTTLDGRYRIRRILGEGGMGIVYEAEHELIERRVAIKVLREDFSRRADVVERFRREAKSASRIGHPNIVDILDFGTTPAGASYFVMELLQGEDLADLLAREIRLSPSRAVAVAVQCCRALAAAHEKGIVHRDLKPENVFIVDRGGFPDFVKLVDFGVAKMTELENGEGGRKLTRTGMIFGTPEYMSPEQANGQALDHRVDVYALGVILFETLTGRVPFEGESFMAVLSKHAAAPVPALREVWPGLQVSPELDAVVHRALTKQRDQRFAHMRAFCEALEAVPEMPDTLPRDSLVPVHRSSVTSSPGLLDASSSASGTVSAPFVSSVAPAVIDSQRATLPAVRRGHVLGAMAVASALVAAVLGWVAIRRAAQLDTITSSKLEDVIAQTPAAEEAPAPAPSPVAAAAAPATPSPVPELDEVPATVAAAQAKDLVTLRVSTRPAGARLQLADGGEVCRQTPCSIEVARGTSVSLLARRGTQRATKTLEPATNTEVHLVLDGPATSKRSAMPAEARDEVPAGRSASTESDDLKTPDAFK